MSSSYISKSTRKRVFERASFRCEYCQTSQKVIGPLLVIDHIVSEVEGGSSEVANLCVACTVCNGSKWKNIEATDPVSTHKVRLFHPRNDRWDVHFEWDQSSVYIRGLTSIGRATVQRLNMNHPDVVLARQLWVAAGWHPPVD